MKPVEAKAERVKIAREDSCPCGSGKLAGDCCLRLFPVRKSDGTLVTEPIILIPSTNPMPPAPRTGSIVNGCYAAPLSDCEGPLTDEHFISHRALKRLAGVEGLLYVRGIDPKDPVKQTRLATKSIAAAVLCKRHNSALLPIDTAGNRFFASLSDARDFFAAAKRGESRVAAVSGPDFERWCLKALCGFIARTGRPVPELWVRMLFGVNDIVSPRGLHVFANLGDTLEGDDIKLEELIHHGEPIGLVVKLRQHEFVLTMHPEIAKAAPWHKEKTAMRRPGLIHMNGDTDAVVAVCLSWPDYDLHAAILSKWSEGSSVLTA